jgi:DNA-binding response OmpR family regulator
MSGSHDLRGRSLEAGCNDFILKPFDTFELLTRMASLV